MSNDLIVQTTLPEPTNKKIFCVQQLHLALNISIKTNIQKIFSTCTSKVKIVPENPGSVKYMDTNEGRHTL